VGSKPGSSRFNLFSHFHHFTAEPQKPRYSYVTVYHIGNVGRQDANVNSNTKSVLFKNAVDFSHK
jgi:hypothetical protein